MRIAVVGAGNSQDLSEECFRLDGECIGVAEHTHRFRRIVKTDRIFCTDENATVECFFVIVDSRFVQFPVNGLPFFPDLVDTSNVLQNRIALCYITTHPLSFRSALHRAMLLYFVHFVAWFRLRPG